MTRIPRLCSEWVARGYGGSKQFTFLPCSVPILEITGMQDASPGNNFMQVSQSMPRLFCLQAHITPWGRQTERLFMLLPVSLLENCLTAPPAEWPICAVQVLTALAAAQSLGFRHWDLRLKNIMEHTGMVRARPLAHMKAANAHEWAGN